MERLYIIDPKNFKGSVINTMPFVDVKSKNGEHLLQHTYVHYSDKTFEEYNKEHKGGLIALTWEDFERNFYGPFLKDMQEPFKETTEEEFWNGLECLPPKRWTQFNEGEFFFVGECYTANLYSCYVRKGEKYFRAIRAINTKAEDIINLLAVRKAI